MIDFVGTILLLSVAIWVAMETIHMFPSYHILLKINPIHEVNLVVSIRLSLDVLLPCQCVENQVFILFIYDFSLIFKALTDNHEYANFIICI